jgi:hypothetical protein
MESKTSLEPMETPSPPEPSGKLSWVEPELTWRRKLQELTLGSACTADRTGGHASPFLL